MRADRERLSTQSFDWGTAVLTPPKVQTSEGQCLVMLCEMSKGHITFYNFEAVSVKFQFHLYMTSVSVGSRGTGIPHKNIIKKLVPFHFKTMIHAHIYTHILTYYGICVYMDT